MILRLAMLWCSNQRWRFWLGALISLLLIAFVGSLVALSPNIATLTVSSILLLSIFVIMLVKPQPALLFLLMVLSLGIETLDLSEFLTTFPVIAQIRPIVPTGSITVYDLLIGLILIVVLMRDSIAPYKPKTSKNITSIGKYLLLYLTVGL